MDGKQQDGKCPGAHPEKFAEKFAWLKKLLGLKPETKVVAVSAESVPPEIKAEMEKVAKEFLDHLASQGGIIKAVPLEALPPEMKAAIQATVKAQLPFVSSAPAGKCQCIACRLRAAARWN